MEFFESEVVLRQPKEMALNEINNVENYRRPEQLSRETYQALTWIRVDEADLEKLCGCLGQDFQ